MDIKRIDFSDKNGREFTTPGGDFISFIPKLFKGEKGKMIIVEKTMIENISNGEPVAVREKTGKNDNKYFVIRAPKPGEKKFKLFIISSGGGQDHREDYGWFKIKNIANGFVVYDISSWWGSNHEVLIALEDGGSAELEGNHGAGFKSRSPQPDFLIRLKSDGSEQAITDLDLD